MTLRAKTTQHNSYGQVLFSKGKEYKVTREGANNLLVLNELHSETPIRKSVIPMYFEEVAE